MDEYYIKYAKPLEELSIEELKEKLLKWQNWAKEELELIIFISNGVKNESMNKLSQSSKSKTLALLEQLKAQCMDQMESLNEFSCEINSEIIEDIDTQVYAKLELNRENYNSLVLNNQKAIINSEILIDLKEKFYKMKKVLNEGSEEEEENSITPPQTVSTSPYYCKRKCDIVKPAFTNSTEGYPKANKSKPLQFQKGKRQNAEEASFNFENDEVNKATAASKLKAKSQWNMPSRQTPDLKEKTIDDNINNPSNYDSRSSQIIQIRTEMMLMKEDMKRLLTMKKDAKSKENEERIYQLSEENNNMKNDIFQLKKEIEELRGIVLSTNKRMNEVIEENQSIRRHNQSLINYISTSTQYKPEVPLSNNSNLPSSTGAYFNYQHSPHQVNAYSYQNQGYKNKSNSNNRGDSVEELSHDYISDINEAEMSQ